MIPRQKTVRVFNDPYPNRINFKNYFDLKWFFVVLFIEAIMILSEYAKDHYHYTVIGLSASIVAALIMAAISSTLFKWYFEQTFRVKP